MHRKVPSFNTCARPSGLKLPPLALLIAALLWSPLALAQEGPVVTEPEQEESTSASGALRVFLDCERVCDFDYLRRSVRFVNYVRDRQDAQVHVLVNVEFTSASLQFDLEFIGLEDFAGVSATHRYSSSNTNTNDERRRGFARVFSQGLIPYVIGTPLASRIDISYDEEESGSGSGHWCRS